MKTRILLFMTLITLGVKGQIPTYVPSNGLVLWCPFDGNYNDYSGKGNNLTSVGSVPFSTDRFGDLYSCISLEGFGQYLSKTFHNLPTGNTPRTLSLWYSQINSPIGNNTPTLFSYGDSGFCNTGFSLSITPQPDPGYYFWGRCNDLFYNSSYSLNTWYHVVLVYDNNLLSIYRNGNLIDRKTIPNSMNTSSLTKLLIGNGRNGEPTQGENHPFSGSIDDIGMWNRSLSFKEVQQLYTGKNDSVRVWVTDTLVVYDTTRISVTDTIILTVYDTTYLSVTDTLIIKTTFTGVGGTKDVNTLKVYPNPVKDHLFINTGDYQSMTGYSVKIINSTGQEIYTGLIDKSEMSIDITKWNGKGLYFLQLVDNTGNIVDIRKIILQ